MSFLPKTLPERFIAGCFLVAILGVGSGIFVSEFDLSGHAPNNLKKILWGAASLGLIFGTPSMTIMGLLRARRNGFSYKTLRMPILGFVLCFCFTFISWYSGRLCEKTLAMIRESSELLTKPPRHFEGIDPEIYSQQTKHVAASRFLYLGEVSEYKTPNGDTKMYEPTDEDKRSHEIMIRSRAALAEIREAMNVLMYSWMACALLSALFGMFWPLRKQS